MTGESHVSHLCSTQLGLITRLPAGLAGIQILRQVGGLSNGQNRPETKTGYFHPKIFPGTSFHTFHLRNDLEYVGKTKAVVNLFAPAGTGARFRPTTQNTTSS